MAFGTTNVGAPDRRPRMTTVTLTAAGWNSSALTQSVAVSGILADETKQLIQATPAGASMAVAAECGIYCSAQAANSLTFKCATIPTVAVTVNICWQSAVKV